MTSTESTAAATTTTRTSSTTIATTSGNFGNVEDIQDENLLREMWQDTEDGDAKRQIRSRMYKLREERLKEYYGREGQDILDSILKQPLEAAEDKDGGMEEERRVTTSTESYRTMDGGGGAEVLQQSRTVHQKQTKVLQQQHQSGSGGNVVNTVVTTTTTTACGGRDGENVVSRTTKSRIINKDRGAQLEEVKSQQRASSRKNVSSSDAGGAAGSRPLSKRSSVESDISVTKGSKSKNMTNGVASKRKQTTTTTVTTTSGGAATGGSSGGNSGRTTRTTTTTVSTDDKGDGGVVAVRMDVGDQNQNRRSENKVAALSRNFQEQISQQTTMTSGTRSTITSSSSVMMTSSSSSFGTVGGAMSTRVSSTRTVMTSGGGQQQGLMIQEASDSNQSQRQGDGSNLEVGEVVIKEINNAVRDGGNETTTASSTQQSARRSVTSTATSRGVENDNSNIKVTRTQTRVSSGTTKRDANNLTNESSPPSQADRKTTRTSSSSSSIMNSKGTTTSMSSSAKSNRTSSTSNRSSLRSSNQPATPTNITAVDKKDGSFSSSVEAQEKLCRRSQQHKLSRESSPKSRTSRRQVATDDNSQSTTTRRQRETSSSSPTRKTTASSRTTQAVSERLVGNRQSSPSKETAGAKVAVGSVTTTATGKKDEESEKTTKITEEKIMRELDILDTYLSQRSASIDEGNNTRGEETTTSTIKTSTLTTPTAAATTLRRSTSPAVVTLAKMNGSRSSTTVVGEERKTRKSDKNFSSLGKTSESTTTTTAASAKTTRDDGERVDVMESGLEPPFTRTVYKRNCPDDHDHDRGGSRRGHSPDKSPDRSRPTLSPAGGKKDGKSNDEVADLESEIIGRETVVVATATTATASPTRRADRAISRSTSSTSTTQKTTASSLSKADKSGSTTTKPKRTPSQSPEKTKRNSNSSSSPSKTTDTISTTTTTTTSSNPSAENSSASRGRKATARTSTSSTTATVTAAKSSKTGSSRKTEASSVTELNTKTSAAGEEKATTSHVTSSKHSSDRKTTTGTRKTVTDAEKYEADILSRPSVFTARKATAVKGSSATGTPLSSTTATPKPNPNPRLRKASDSSPERDVIRAGALGDDEDEEILNSAKRFTTTATGSTGNNKQLESPGAVLKAKSLFENKAQEAAKDRSSIELGSKVSTSPKLTVSKKAALFEARSRGERISISSDEEEEPTQQLPNEKQSEEYAANEANNKGHLPGEQCYKTSRIPEVNEVAFTMERRASQVVSVVRKEERELLQQQHQSTLEEDVDSTEADTVISRKTEIKKSERKSSPPAASRPIGKATPPREPSQKREKSPSRAALLVEKNDRITNRRKSSATMSRTSESPERPSHQTRRASEATAHMLSKNSNTNGYGGGVVGVVRTVHRTVIEENNNNNQRRGSIGILTTVDKRHSVSQVEKLPIEAPIDLIDLKRKDSRGISLASSKIIIQNQQQRKMLQDIEQKLSNDSIVIRDHLEESPERDLSPSPSPPPSPRRGNSDVGGRIKIDDKTSALSSELKSTNVVKQATRRQQQQKIESSNSTTSTTVNSAEPAPALVEDLPQSVTSKPPSPRRSSPPAPRRSSPPACKRASKSPERSSSPPRSKMTTPDSTKQTITAERRRSSKVEAIVASLKQSSSSSGTSSTITTATTSSSTANRMTTAELNAVEETENIEELEALLDKATDYDERSKIRGRIRFLKRKATLVKRVSDYNGTPEKLAGGDAPLAEKPKAQSPLRQGTGSTSTGAVVHSGAVNSTSSTTVSSSVERRASKESKVTSTSRKSSSNDLLLQQQDKKRVSSRKGSSDELIKKSTGKSPSSLEKDKENRRVEEESSQLRGNRSPSPQKSDRQPSPTESTATMTATTTSTSTTATSQRKSVERSSSSQRIQSRSNSGRVGKINNAGGGGNDNEKSKEVEQTGRVTSVEKGEVDHHRNRDQRQGTELKRKLSTETSELLSTRNYSRDHEKRGVEEKQVVSSKPVVPDQELYSSRRNSRNLEEDDDVDRADVDRLRKSKVTTKSGSPSPTTATQRRLKQTEEEREEDQTAAVIMKEKSSSSRSGSVSPKSKPSSRASSPQRSEIPISSRMKRERSLSPPRRMTSPPKEISTSVTTITSQIDVAKSEQVEGENVATVESKEVQQQSQQQELEQKTDEDKDTIENTKSYTSTSASTTASRKVSSRKSSATEIIGEEKTTGRVTVGSHERKPSGSQRMTDAEKYEADILSRPSVFTARRAVAVAKSEPTEKTTSPATRRSPSPDREKGSVKETSSQRTTTIRETSSQRGSPVVTRENSSRSITSSKTTTEESTATTTRQRKQSTEESNKSSRSNAYTRKGSSKELTKRLSKGAEESETPTGRVGGVNNVIPLPSAEPESVSTSQEETTRITTGAIPESNVDDDNEKQVTSEDKTSRVTSSRSITTTSTVKSSATAEDRQQKAGRVITRSSPPPPTGTVTGSSNKTGGVSSITTTTTRRTTGSTTGYTSQQKKDSASGKKVTEPVQATDLVTSSYGVGPVDDDGKPLFGLRALRKIKQAQEQKEAAATQENVADEKNDERTTPARESSTVINKVSTSTRLTQGSSSFTPSVAAVVPGTLSTVTSNLESLRSNDMYGLRALRKQAAEVNSSDNEQTSPSSTRASSVEKDRRSNNMSSSTSSRITTTVTTSSALSTQQNSKSSALANERVTSEPRPPKESLIQRKMSSEESEGGLDDDQLDEIEMQTCTDTRTTSPTSSATTITCNSYERKTSSPKSILKKTSSFTTNSSSNSSSSGRKNSNSGKDESSPTGREPIPESVKEGDSGIHTTTRSGATTSTGATSSTTSSARSSVERKISGKIISQDDESWRRQRSHSPSPKLPASASTASSIATFSRGKVGRSSVREMSRRFESDNDEQQDGNVMSKSSSSTSLTTTSTSTTPQGWESPASTTIIRTGRAESPSRIPLSIKSTTTVVSTAQSSALSGNERMENDNDGHDATSIIAGDSTQTSARGMTAPGVAAVSTTTTVESFETGGPIICRDADGGQVCIQSLSQQQKLQQQRHIEKSSVGGGGSISITSNVVQSRRVVTTTSSTSSSVLGRSFLNDQSPIQNLEDVITRMRGEDPELMKPFVEEQPDGDDGTGGVIQRNSSSTNQGRNLLNKFIGAQVIMQAVEPMLIAQQKVSMSMSSSLEQSGADVEADPAAEEDSSEKNVSEMVGNCQIEEVEETSQQTRSLGGSGSVDITEESSTQLTQEVSTASESSTGAKQDQPATTCSLPTGDSGTVSVSSAADVTGELMPLILDQLQSSLDSFSSSSASTSVVAGGGSVSENNSIIGGGGPSTNNNVGASSGHTVKTSAPYLQSHNILHQHPDRRHSSPLIVSGKSSLSSTEQRHNTQSVCESGNNSSGNKENGGSGRGAPTAEQAVASSSGAAVHRRALSLSVGNSNNNAAKSYEGNGAGATTPTGSSSLSSAPSRQPKSNSSTILAGESTACSTGDGGGDGGLDPSNQQEEEHQQEREQTQRECLFDSGTESGGISAIDDDDEEEEDEDTVVVLEDPSTSTVALLPSPVDLQSTTSQYDDTSGSSATEFSSFIQGLKNSLKRNANKESPLQSYYNYQGSEGGSGDCEKCDSSALTCNNITSQDDCSCLPIIASSTCVPEVHKSPSVEKNNDNIIQSRESSGIADEAGVSSGPPAEKCDDSGLIQQVDKVLTLLRASLVKDPQSCLAQIPKNPAHVSTPPFSNSLPKEKELIALIDRLKFSLISEQDYQQGAVPQEQEEKSDRENPFTAANSITSSSSGAVLNNNSRVEINTSVCPTLPTTSGVTKENTGQSAMLVGCASQPHPHHDISPFPPSRSSSNPWVAADFSASSEQINSASSNLSLLSSSTDQIHNPDSGSSPTMVEQKNNALVNNGGNNYASSGYKASNGGDGVPWKIRLARRRSQPRSHTVGVTQEELAQARRLFEEATGFRLDHTAPSGGGYSRQEQEPRYNNANAASVYSKMQDLSSSGAGNNNSNIISKYEDDDDDDEVFVRSSINNYGESGSSDAGVVGTVPAYVNPVPPSAPQSHRHHQAKQQGNLPHSMSSSALSFPHDFSCSLEDVGMMSTTNSTTDASSGRDKHHQGERLPSGGSGMSTATTPTTPNWQTDVEKRLSSIPRPFVPFVKNATQFYEGYQPPPERRMTYASIDDSIQMPGGVMGNLKIKPFRTYSLDSNKPNATDDPSKSLFTPQETVQIAIHQAAIKKQMSEEEDRRKRRNSLTSSYKNYGNNASSGAGGGGGGSPGVKQDILLPKPYSPPKQQQLQRDSSEGNFNNLNRSLAPTTSSQNNGYSPLFQSGADSGYTEESGTETNQKDDKLAMQPSYDSSPVHNNAPVDPMAVVPFTSSGSSNTNNNNNSVVNISAGNGNGGHLNDSLTGSSANTITYTTTPSGGFIQQQQQQQSPKRIENVQISLKELSSSEFPQLQIAITLNTNNGPSNENSGKGTTVSVVEGGGGPNSSYVSRIPNVTTTSTATSVTTNLQLGGGGGGMGYNGTRPQQQQQQQQPMEMSGSGGNPQYFSNDEGQQASASLSRAIRYKSKNERKKRMKRANTIDIPHPPGLLLQSNNNDDDDTTGMEDEEDSDSNNYSRMMKNLNSGNNVGGGDARGGGNGINSQSGKYQPFQPKTEGDRKFLAFLEKNNALTEQSVIGARPLRPSHLGVSNDRQWLSRFSNLKTSFESSSQGSSPSASPIPSPLRPPRSVSEMALTQERRGGASSAESFNKPVWANTDKSQLPPQVRNKLHVFENRSFEGNQTTTQDYPHWRSPPPPTHGWQPQQQQHHHHHQQHAQHSNQFGGGGHIGNRNMGMMPGMKQTVSTNALNQLRGQPASSSARMYNRPAFSSHDNMALVGQKKIQFQGNSFDSKLNQQHHQLTNNNNAAMMRRPTPVKLQSHLPSNTKASQGGGVGADVGGVHMVHATAAALEAMKKSAMAPASSSSTSVVPVQNVNQQSTIAGFPHTKVTHDDKIDLPWAKRGQDSPVLSPSISSRDSNANRVHSSKARFEQPISLAQHHQPQLPPTSTFQQATATTNSSPSTTTAAYQQYRQSGKTSSLDSSPVKFSPHHVETASPNPAGYFGGGAPPQTSSKVAQQLGGSGSSIVSGAGPIPQQQQMGGSAEDFVPVVRPSLKTFGVTQSFDEAFKRKLDQQIASGAVMYSDDERNSAGGSTLPQQQQQVFPAHGESSREVNQPSVERMTIGQSSTTTATMSNSINSTKMPFELQQSSGSAFARQVPISAPNIAAELPPSSVQSNVQSNSPVKSSGTSPVATAPAVVGDDGMILTPVVAKVMRGPQQQRATFQNRMSSLQDDQQNTRLTGARSNLRNFLNIHQAAASSSSSTNTPAADNSKQDEQSPSSQQMKFSSSSSPQGSLLNLPPLTKSLSGDAILNNSPNSIVKPALPTTPSHDNNDATPEVRRAHQQPSMAATPQQPSSISSSNGNESPAEQQRPTIIPRQKSLSEFPKATNPPAKIEPLTIDTDLLTLSKQSSLNHANNNRVTATNNHPSIHLQQNNMSQQQRPAGGVPQHQQQQQHHHHHTHKSQASIIQQQQQQQQSKMPMTHPHHPQQQALTKPTTRSYPDSLHRTSSGSSIFSRAKNLFFGSQDGAHPPSTKLRPKLPNQLSTSPQSTKLTFPKQFEAQMSPDSADRKQQEVAAYFKQQLQQQEMLQRQSGSCSGSGVGGGGKNGVDSKAKKSADAAAIVTKSETETQSSASITVECEKGEMKASSSFIQSSTSSSLTSSSVSSTTKIQSVSSSSSSLTTMQSANSARSALPTTPMNRFKAMDQANPAKKTAQPLFKFANEGLKASATSAKDILLYWCQCRTREYENVKIENFSSSWSDGLAFCALIHHFYPDAFDYNSLNPRNRKYNFDLAFRTAEEKADIYPLLDTEDMVAMGTRPDWKCVFTYVQSMYQKLKDM